VHAASGCQVLWVKVDSTRLRMMLRSRGLDLKERGTCALVQRGEPAALREVRVQRGGRDAQLLQQQAQQVAAPAAAAAGKTIRTRAKTP
jgi:hypothetical protein